MMMMTRSFKAYVRGWRGEQNVMLKVTSSDGEVPSMIAMQSDYFSFAATEVKITNTQLENTPLEPGAMFDYLSKIHGRVTRDKKLYGQWNDQGSTASG